MADKVVSETDEQAVPMPDNSDSTGAGPEATPGISTPSVTETKWVVRWWRLIPPLLVLLTVCYIWLTNFGQLMANHWAYPALLVFVGFLALLMVIGARPRKRTVRRDLEPPQ